MLSAAGKVSFCSSKFLNFSTKIYRDNRMHRDKSKRILNHCISCYPCKLFYLDLLFFVLFVFKLSIFKFFVVFAADFAEFPAVVGSDFVFVGERLKLDVALR